MWLWEPAGLEGKSYLATWLVAWRNAYLVTGGKWQDIIYAYGDERYVVFDLARDQVDKVPYNLMEKFKNGFAFSGKYESKSRIFPPANVVVMANFAPDESKLSADRWDIRPLTDAARRGDLPGQLPPPVPLHEQRGLADAPPAVGLVIPSLIECDSE